MSQPSRFPAAPGLFPATRWSVLRTLATRDGEAAMAALEHLCTDYWYPLYAYIRGSGYGKADAEDLTQGFFAAVLRKETFLSADPAKGRLRTFLIACLKRFLKDEREKAHAAKRTPAEPLVPLEHAEERYAAEPAAMTPDRIYQRRWALTMLESSLNELAARLQAEGKGDWFEVVRPYLGFRAGLAPPPFGLAAARLGVPEGTLKSHVFRLRRQWKTLLYEIVGRTLENPSDEEIRAELAELLECL